MAAPPRALRWLSRLFDGRPEIRLSRFRPSPFVVDLEAPSAAPHRTFRFRTGRVQGTYDMVDGHLFAMFRWRGALYFRADEQVITLDSLVGSEWSELEGGRQRFALLASASSALHGHGHGHGPLPAHAHAPLFACEYRVPTSELDKHDLGYEPGQNDFLRWVAWVLDAPDAKATAYAEWSPD